MSYYRSYFEKDTGIINESRVNTGRNEVTDLTYGNVPIDIFGRSQGETVFTRYLFKADLTGIQTKYDSGVLIPSRVAYHKVRLYNTINLDRHLLTSETPYGARRPYGFTLNLYRVEQAFSEGRGHTYLYDNVFSTQQSVGFDDNDSPANWFDRQVGLAWPTPGVIDTSTATPIATARLELGYENAEFDVTDDINSVLRGNSQHLGYVVTFTPDLEAFDDDRLNTVSFFGRLTNTFFEPHIETVYDDIIYDDSLYSNSVKVGGSYLYFNSPSQPQVLTILNDCGNEVGTLQDAEAVDPPIYRTFVPLAYDIEPFQNFTLRYQPLEDPDGAICELDFTAVPREACISTPPSHLSDYYLDIKATGLYSGERIARGTIRKVKFTVRELEGRDFAFPLRYRIVTRQGRNIITVSDWETVSRLNNEYFIKLDTEWLIPQDYTLEVRCFNDGDESPTPAFVDFSVDSEKIDYYTGRL